MKKIKLIKGQFVIVDDEDFEWLMNIGGWHLNKDGYAIADKIIKGKRHIIRMHRLINKTSDFAVTDHINGNRLDNRKLNLRSCSISENLRNRGKQKNNTSGFKGVHWNKEKKKWMASIKLNKKSFHLGYYPTIGDAANAYNEAALCLHGEFAYFNNMKGGY